MSNAEIAKRIIEHCTRRKVILADDWLDADKLISRAKMPATMMFVPMQGRTVLRNGRKYHTDTIIIACADLVVKDADGKDSIEAYNKARERADEIVAYLNNSQKFEPITEYEYTTFLNRYSTIISGVFISISLTNKGECDDGNYL